MRHDHGLAFIVAALLLGCGGATHGDTQAETQPLSAGACFNAATGECNGYRLPAADLEAARQGCPFMGWGTWIPSCPPANRLGTCSVDAPAPALAERTWYPGWMSTVDEARQACALLHGTFVAGTGAGSAATQQHFSCDRRGAGVTAIPVPTMPAGWCTDVDALLTPELVTALQFYCGFFGGTPLAAGAACPTAGRTGTCRVTDQRGLAFDARSYDPARGSATCSANGGTWTGG